MTITYTQDQPPAICCCLIAKSCPALCDPHGLQHTRFPCPSLSSRVCLNSYPLSQWCTTTISFFVSPFSSCPQSFLASGSFPMSWLFTSGGQSIAVSASVSVFPMSIQCWFPLGLTGLISWLSTGLSRVFSSTTVQQHQFFNAHPSLWYNYWKNHSFDYPDLCKQSDVSAF